MTLPWNLRQVVDFWSFVAERHEVFLRRVVHRQPPPWTRDESVAGVYYTNVYRELDRLTRYVQRHVLLPEPDSAEVLFNLVKFRYFNWIPTWEALGGFAPRAAWDQAAADTALLARQAAGHKVFTGAYMVQARSTAGREGFGSKIKLYTARLSQVAEEAPALWDEIDQILPHIGDKLDSPHKQMGAIHAALKRRLPGVSDFLAYELLIDLNYARLPFTEDDWVNVGPGAKLGLSFLLESRPVRGSWTWLDALMELRHEWQGRAARAGAQRLRGPVLTLRNVEHSLCEYSKYYRASRGTTHHPKRRYRAETANPDFSLWEGLPARFYRPLLPVGE